MAGFWEGGLHETSGLAGYPARDYGAPAGTGVHAWAQLQVTRISGASGSRGRGFGGYNVYLRDRNGKQFFLTHVENLQVKAGTVLQPGQPIAQVGGYPGMAQHVHIGYQGGDPDAVLGLKPNNIFSAQGAAVGSRTIQSSIARQATQPQGGYKGPLADVPVLGPAGRATTRGLDWVLNPVDQAIGVAKAPFDAIKWVGGNWDRVLEVAGGFVLLLIGLLLIGKSVGFTPKPSTVIVGDLANRAQFGPTVTKARSENLRTGTSHDVSGASDTLPRRSQGATTASGDDIPY